MLNLTKKKAIEMLKKILSVVLSVALIVCLMPMGAVSVLAEASGDYTYTVASGEATVTSYTGFGGDIVIPSTLDGYPVSGIGASAFEECDVLTSVVIPDGVTSIGERAFYSCDNLGMVFLPGSLTHIGHSAFYSCSILDGVEFPEGLQTIDGYAFERCGLTSLWIPASVTTIGDGAFADCADTLASITVAEGNTVYRSVDNCLIDIAGKKLVAGCSNSVIPADGSVTKIGPSAFAYYTGGELIIPEGVTEIERWALSYGAMTSVTLPVSLKTIGAYAFFVNNSLIDIWYNGTESDKANMSIGVENRGLNSAVWHYAEAVAEPEYTYDIFMGKAAISGYTGTDTHLVIPSEIDGYPVTMISGNAFKENAELVSVTIPEGVTSIGERAFESCTQLTTVNVPDTLKIVGGFAFWNCSSLLGLDLPDTVTEMGPLVFWNCDSMTSFTIPSGVTSLGEQLFSDCDGLTEMVIPDTVTEMAENLFWGCTALEKVTLSNNVTNLPSGTFRECTGLTSVTIPNSVTTISTYAFEGCTGLKSVTIPESVTTICITAFIGCTAITDVWYGGTASDYAAMNIGKYNDSLLAATWHYAEDVTEPEEPTITDILVNPDISNGITLIVTYSDGSVEYVTDGYTVTGFDPTATGDQEITVTYQGYTKTFVVKVKDAVIDDTAPAFVLDNAVAKAGETFTVAIRTKNNPGVVSIKLAVGYDSNVVELVSSEFKDFTGGLSGTSPMTDNPFIINWADALNPNNTTNGVVALLTFKVKDGAAIGDTAITLSYDPEDVYDENFDNVTFATVDGTVSVVEYVDITVTDLPTKLNYLQAKDAFDPAGGKVTVTYSNGFTEVIDLTVDMVSGFDNTKVGKQTLTVMYEGLTDTFDVEIFAKTLTSIAVTATPTKMEYLEAYDALDVIGGKVTLYYDNGTSEEIDLTVNMVSGFDNTIVGKQTLTVTYEGFTDTYDVEILAKSLTSIEITTNPRKTVYLKGVGAVSVAGGKVTLYYNNATSEVIDLTADMVSGFDNTTVGEQHVMVTYETLTTTFPVVVLSKDSPYFEVENVTAKAGDTVTVAIRTKNNPGIVSLKLAVGYDSNVLELVSSEWKDFTGGVSGTSPLTDNPFTINWANTLSGNNDTDGVVALLTFKVKDGAAIGETAITLNYDADDVYDQNYTNVMFATVDGAVNVIEYISGDVNGDTKINNKDLGMLLQYLNNWEVEVEELACDVNRDGKINNKDLGILLQYLNNWDVELK